MPRAVVASNERMALRIPAKEKAVLLRAASLRSTDLTDFVRMHSLRAALEVIEEAERVKLSARDSLRVMRALEKPAAPNAKLRRAAKALAKNGK
jgi:uncharacterized protein (DUF1778 family)